MKFIVFDKETFPKYRSESSPKITFGKSGTITLNKAAVNAIGLKVGDTIAFVQDQEEHRNWFLYQTEKGFTLRGKDEHSLTTNHSHFVRSFKKANSIAVDQTISFLIAGCTTTVGKIKYWGILIPE